MAGASVAEVVANLRKQMEEKRAMESPKAPEAPKPAEVVTFPKPEEKPKLAESLPPPPNTFPNYGEAMAAELERLRAENEALRKRKGNGLSLKVSEKGAVSLYGMGRFPVTLYREQWERVLGAADEIRAFIAENESRLKVKE